MDPYRLLLKLFSFQHGMAVFFAALLACWAWRAMSPQKQPLSSEGIVARLLPGVYALVTLLCMGLYVAYPSFSDHVESSVVVLGHLLSQGQSIYPQTFDHTLTGLLYGPLLFEINAAALSLPLAPEHSSKLPAVFAFAAAMLLTGWSLADRRGWLFLLLIGPFSYVFINSGQPFLLLCSALALTLMVKMERTILQALFIGVLAGASMSIKLHGLLYVAAIYLVMEPRWWASPMRLVAIAAGTASVFLLTFAPQATSLPGFFNFIGMATRHGLSTRILVENLFLVVVLWLPLWMMWRAHGPQGNGPMPGINVLLLVAIEVVVATIGSKKGAGSWHLLPFVLAHAQVFVCLLSKPPAKSVDWMLPAFAVALLATVVNAVPPSIGMVQGWRDARTSKQELLGLAAKYPGLFLATGDKLGYEHIYQRIHLERLGMRQIDFPGFIDLQSAGVSDAPLSRAMRDCLIPYIVVPRGEPAFSNTSNYTKAPLFSNEVRAQFGRSFTLVDGTSLFDVYRCQC